jgi:uncharacterized coiled-coil protein SlyX
MDEPQEMQEVRERLGRLEESLAFAQHDQDALSAQLQAFQSDLRAMESRLRRVEAAFQRLSGPGESSAPHSGSASDGQLTD